MKSFIFLYPISEIFDNEIKDNWIPEKSIETFRQKYKESLNKCIDLRYRQRGFSINYALFDNHKISDIIERRLGDRIIEVGMDFKTHTTKGLDGEFPYPNPDFILDRLGNTHVLRIAGFHMWDCVDRLAKKAYERKMYTLVDEDLTEFFPARLRDEDFKFDTYPTFNPKKRSEKLNDKLFFEKFMEARKGKPWLWQKY